jgi:arsenate reductase
MMAGTVRVYGIASCDSVREARRWLADAGVAHDFHDFRKDGLPPELLDAWLGEVGWEGLLNRKGTTWRKLDDATKAFVRDAATARALLLAHPTLIKRPVVAWPRTLTVGFDRHRFAALAG